MLWKGCLQLETRVQHFNRFNIFYRRFELEFYKRIKEKYFTTRKKTDTYLFGEH
jgi:hypothetical protein